jgi:hypothetical protein
MGKIQERYEKETGEDATYLIGASTYHTLKYVGWLEKELSKNKDTELLDWIDKIAKEEIERKPND